ncbi:MAG: SDR family NAD(P)-dependent oxidoreductase [Pseudobdellovibrionaceae bacterium]
MQICSSRFKDRVAIITGAASGIGLATAQRMGAEGGRIVLVDLHQDKLTQAEKSVSKSGAPETWTSVCDVSHNEQVSATMSEVFKKFGRIDVIVNCAGLMVFKPLEDHSLSDWEKVLGVDLLGTFYFIQQGFKYMKQGGTIVNVSSIHAEETTPRVASYAAAKAAVLSLTRSAAIEGKPRGIRVSAVLPGAVDTPMLWENPNIKAGLETIKQTDVGKPEEVAAAISYLASEDAHFIQGASLRVDGGRLAQL